MAAHRDVGAAAPGLVTPASETAHVASAGRIEEQVQDDDANFHASGIAQQAAPMIEGEAYALAYLDRLQSGTAQPGELAVIVTFLAGEMLHGACRAIEKALEGQRHA